MFFSFTCFETVKLMHFCMFLWFIIVDTLIFIVNLYFIAWTYISLFFHSPVDGRLCHLYLFCDYEQYFCKSSYMGLFLYICNSLFRVVLIKILWITVWNKKHILYFSACMQTHAPTTETYYLLLLNIININSLWQIWFKNV